MGSGDLTFLCVTLFVLVLLVSLSRQESQLRFSAAVRRGKYGDNPSEVDMILYDIKSFDQQVQSSTNPDAKSKTYRIGHFPHTTVGVEHRQRIGLRRSMGWDSGMSSGCYFDGMIVVGPADLPIFEER